ncbi:CHAT domain-containing protein [Fulvivirga sp. 29W222]|uniref:CHAT domain-containing protein n=1 Tax=Fulvivirga marina TaxID=2494733 RepID=A0A937KBF4_9BACT|nr:CHAT domain-containing protein [Fulvivirga marina]MBL6446836.1 CHAT domain-containing protein [Fulvivirga marina]
MCGLFMLSSVLTVYGQEARLDFMGQVDSTMDRYYFENADSALYYLNKLYRKAVDNRWSSGVLYVLLNKAYVAEHHFMIDSLDIFLDQGDSICNQYRNDTETIDPDNNLIAEVSYMRGMYYYYQGDFLNALLSFKKTIFDKDILQISDSLQTFNGLVNISQLAIFNSDYGRAMQFANMASKTLPMQYPSYTSVRDYDYQRAFIDAVKSRIQFLQNQPGKNINIYRGIKSSLKQSIERIKHKENEAGTHNLFLKLYTQLADVYVALEDYDSALVHINKGMLLSKGADKEQQIKFLYEAANVHLKKGDDKTATKLVREGQDIALRDFDERNRFIARAYYEMGNIHASRSEWTRSLSAYQQSLLQLVDSFSNHDDLFALPLLQGNMLESEVLKVLLLKAQTFYRWYNDKPDNKKALFAAVETYEKAVELIDKIRMSFQDADSKQFLSSVTLSSYEEGIQAATLAYQVTSDTKYFEKAFYFAEKSKANQLVQVVKDISSKYFAGIPKDIIEHENQLKGRVYYWKHTLQDSDDADFKVKAQKNLLESKERYEKFIKGLEKEYPEYYQVKYTSKTIGIHDIRSELAKGEVLIEYFYGDQHLYVFAISANDTFLELVPVDYSMHKKLYSFLDLLKKPGVEKYDLEQYEIKAKELYAILLKPVEKAMPKENGHLLIVADGPLGYLPFEALIASEISNESLDFVINKYSVSYDYSATLRHEKKRIQRDGENRRYVGFSPSYNSKESFLSDLKFNHMEVKQAQSYLGGEVFDGENATEYNFYNSSSEASVIHLSLHAKVDDDHPSASALYFYNASVSGQTGADEDNILYLYELYSISLKARLAVLSACETGTGLYARGEGIMSLGRAFQYAGCPSVAMSLWQVNDKSTASIMGEFFQNLERGISKSEALRKAKLSFINDPKNKYFTHPYYWSGFVLMGDDQPISSPSRLMEVLLVFVVLIATTLIVYIKKYRKGSA